MEKNIIIRDLTEGQAEKLENYKSKYGHKTSSKAVLELIEHWENKAELIENQC